jgi:hypothetical protein
MPPFHKILVVPISPFFTVDADGPTLVRVNRMFTAAGATIFATTTGGAIWLSAWPITGEPPGGSSVERMARAWRGAGPLIFLPFAGRWQVTLDMTTMGGALLPAMARAELSLLSMPAEVAANYLNNPPASYHVTGNFTLAAGAATNLFSATGVDLSASPPQIAPAYWHSLVALRVTNNTAGATLVMFALGRVATAAVGRVIPALNAAVYSWPELSGQTCWIHNGSAGNLDVNVEAHFL